MYDDVDDGISHTCEVERLEWVGTHSLSSTEDVATHYSIACRDGSALQVRLLGSGCSIYAAFAK